MYVNYRNVHSPHAFIPTLNRSVRRPAYVVSVSRGLDERSQRTGTILHNLGFDVEYVEPISWKGLREENPTLSEEESKVLSHRNTVLNLLRHSPRPWTYVFEDDIAVHNGVNMESIVELESSSDSFFYLGLCLPHKSDVLLPPPKSNGERACGRCAHALAFSREGASSLLSFLSTGGDSAYFDINVETWCAANDGFPVYLWERHGQQDGHRGGFFQDRNIFETGIG